MEWQWIFVPIVFLLALIAKSDADEGMFTQVPPPKPDKLDRGK